jgi:hypothetical protein
VQSESVFGNRALKKNVRCGRASPSPCSNCPLPAYRPIREQHMAFRTRQGPVAEAARRPLRHNELEEAEEIRIVLGATRIASGASTRATLPTPRTPARHAVAAQLRNVGTIASTRRSTRETHVPRRAQRDARPRRALLANH